MLKKKNFIYFSYEKVFIILLFIKVQTIRQTITSLATVYVYIYKSK